MNKDKLEESKNKKKQENNITEEEKTEIKNKKVEETQNNINEEKDSKKKDEEDFMEKISNRAKRAGIKLIYMALLLYYSLSKLSYIDWVIVSVALMYFFSPIDLIPDFIPIIGYLDDQVIINWALSRIINSLKKNMQYFEEIEIKAKKGLHSIFGEFDEKIVDEIFNKIN